MSPSLSRFVRWKSRHSTALKPSASVLDRLYALATRVSPGIRWALARLLPPAVVTRIRRGYYPSKLLRTRIESEPDLSVVRRLVKPGDEVVDIGANIGLYTLFLSRWVGDDGKVYSVEPIPVTYETLCSNVERLGLRNVETFDVALSDREGTVRMQVPDQNGRPNFYRARMQVDDRDESPRSVDVTRTTLTCLFRHRNKAIAFVKCDVEGHELMCLRGGEAFLDESVAAWLIEVGGDPDQRGSAAFEVFALMERRGYSAWWFDGERLRSRRPGDRSINYFFLRDTHLQALGLIAGTDEVAAWGMQ